MYMHLCYVILSILESLHSPHIWVHTFFHNFHMHTHIHTHLTLCKQISDIFCFSEFNAWHPSKGSHVSALSNTCRHTMCFFSLNILSTCFLNITISRKLKQIDWLVDCTGAYFQEEMWQIVSITSDFRIPISIFLIITHLLSFSILLIVFICRFKLIKYLILQGLSAHHLTPNE